MASPKKEPFWIYVFEQAQTDFSKYSYSTVASSEEHIIRVLDSTGPRFLDRVHRDSNYMLNILPVKLYNPELDSPQFHSNFVYTKHYLTTVWREMLEIAKKRDKLFK